jgi:hypothetical protein
MNRWPVRWLTATAAYAASQFVFGALLLRGMVAGGSPAPAHGALSLGLLSHALVATAVMLVVSRLSGSRLERALAMFVLMFGIQANDLGEASVFSLDIPRRILPMLYLHDLLTSALLAWVAVRFTPAPDATAMTAPPPRGSAGWIARFVACSPVYVVVYLSAGMLAWPFVRPFYEARPMPTMGTLVLVQVVRGLVFAALIAYASRRLAAGPWTRALLCGLALSVIAAVPLLAPNPYMPGFVRMAHLCEVGISNFAFGAFVTWLLTAPIRQSHVAAVPAR